MLKIVAKYADTWNAFGTPQEMRERNQLLDEYCEELGRDPETLDRSLYYWVPKSDADPWKSEQAFRDVIEPYMEAGVNQFLLDQPSDAQYDLLGHIASEVLPKLRREKPRPTSQGVAVNASTWHKPQDHISS
jgi:alkanesulfonate monooxygenase SsuD/methylene tetrahydromethanopterin reductase-like flavin-dependent oxidoreductase (luciferase family)